VPQAGQADRGLGRRHAWAVLRHPYPQRTGTDRAPHGGGQQDGLPVDADRYPVRAARNDHAVGGKHPQAGRVLAAQQADGLPRAVDHDGHHAEHPAVEARATAKARDVVHFVGVAAHQKRLRPVDRFAVGDRGEPGAALPLEQVGQRVEGGAYLVVAIGGCLHYFGVGAERHVVDERVTTDHSEVDPQLDAVGQRAQARHRILAVQAQVKGEVVAGARGDHQEGEAVFGGDAGHQRLGAVAARDAEQVSAVGDRLPGDRDHVDMTGTLHQEDLRPARLRLALQIEFADFPAAGSRVHDQERAPGRDRRVLGHPPVRLVHGQRLAGRHPGQQPAPRGDRRHPQQFGERVNHQHRNRHGDEHRQREPAQHASAGQHEVRGRDTDHRGRQANREHDEALPLRERHYHRDRDERQHEAQPGQPGAQASGRRGRAEGIRRPVGHVSIVPRRRPEEATRFG